MRVVVDYEDGTWFTGNAGLRAWGESLEELKDTVQALLGTKVEATFELTEAADAAERLGL